MRSPCRQPVSPAPSQPMRRQFDHDMQKVGDAYRGRCGKQDAQARRHAASSERTHKNVAVHPVDDVERVADLRGKVKQPA